MTHTTLWLRDEDRETECRTPLLPGGAKELIAEGMELVVERSQKRIFSNHAYAEAGCRMVDAGSWTSAPDDAIILGLKELPSAPKTLHNRHIFFAHAYKEQSGWKELLGRFKDGGGEILDIEYMTDETDRRVVAFGYWAGYMGASLALMQWYDRTSLKKGLSPFENATRLDLQIASLNKGGAKPKILVIGANGRSGKGATKLFQRHGIEVTQWGRTETANIDRTALLAHDIVINCVFVDGETAPFLRPEDLTTEHRLRVISDVSCDPFSDFNTLPLYDAPTDWNKPFLTVGQNGGAVDLIAIDNLPSLLPREASVEFAGLILPYLKKLGDADYSPVWQSSLKAFKSACHALT